MKIEEMNKEIAEFMGNTIIVNDGQHAFVYVIGKDISVDDLLFHASWDWLMPVIGKIQTMLDLADIIETMDYLWTHYGHGLGEQILEIHSTVYQFINYTNSK